MNHGQISQKARRPPRPQIRHQLSHKIIATVALFGRRRLNLGPYFRPHRRVA
jgi:hypothetical protein